MNKNTVGKKRTAKKNCKVSFPLVIRRAGIVVKIYYRKDKRGYDSYSVAHYEHGKRELKPFSALDAAKQHAQSVLQRLVHAEPEGIKLNPQEHLVFQRANSLIEPTGIPLDTAMADYVHLLNARCARSIATTE